MKPINKKERTKAYNKVIGLFLICFVLAILVGFTTMNVNKLANSKSVNELAKLKASLKYEEQTFAPNLDQATKIMVKIPKAKESAENSDLLNSQVADLISDTKTKLVPDNSWQSLMYQNIINVYSNLQLAYKDNTKLQEKLDDCGNSTKGSDKDLERCLEEKRDLQNQLNILKLAGGGGGGGNTADLDSKLKNCNDQVRRLTIENKSLLAEIQKLKNK